MNQMTLPSRHRIRNTTHKTFPGSVSSCNRWPALPSIRSLGIRCHVTAYVGAGRHNGQGQADVPVNHGKGKVETLVLLWFNIGPASPIV